MADISPPASAARETARRTSGQFGAQGHAGPEAALTNPLPAVVAAHYTPHDDPPVAYPEGIPADGVVSVGLEDSDGGVFVSIDFPDGVHVSAGGDSERESQWDTLTDEETPYDEETDEAIRWYLREVQSHVSLNAERVRWAVLDDAQLAEFLSFAQKGAAEPDYSDEASKARVLERGRTLAGLYGPADADPGDQTADAIADILVYARSQGLDIADLLARAEGYAADE